MGKGGVPEPREYMASFLHSLTPLACGHHGGCDHVSAWKVSILNYSHKGGGGRRINTLLFGNIKKKKKTKKKRKLMGFFKERW